MKKIFALFCAALLLFSLTACSGTGAADNPNPSESDSEPDSGIGVDKNLLTVDITVPAYTVQDMTEDEIRTNAEKNGYLNYAIHPDGSVTYTMTRAKHEEELARLRESIEDFIASTCAEEDESTSFRSVDYTDDFSQFDVYVDRSLYTAWDSFFALFLYSVAVPYQSYAGIAVEEIEITVHFIDHQTGDILDTASYREFADNINSEETNRTGDTSDALPIVIEESVSIPDVCEFFVEYTNITDVVVPPGENPSSKYIADNGKYYLDVCLAYKNLHTSAIGEDDFPDAQLLYSGKYQYTARILLEYSNRTYFEGAFWSSIAPLATEYLHYLFEIPAEVAESTHSLDITFTVGGHSYCLNVR